MIISVLYCRRSRLVLMSICLISISSQKQLVVRNNTSSVVYLQVEMESFTQKLAVHLLQSNPIRHLFAIYIKRIPMSKVKTETVKVLRHPLSRAK